MKRIGSLSLLLGLITISDTQKIHRRRYRRQRTTAQKHIPNLSIEKEDAQNHHRSNIANQRLLLHKQVKTSDGI